MKKFILILTGVFLWSCQQEPPLQWVAKYKDNILTKNDIQAVIPKGLSKDDSLQFVNQHIEKWAKDKIVLSEVADLLSQEEINSIEAQAAAYKEDLFESAIEDKFMLGFSNEVAEEEMKTYYEQYPDTFILKNDVLSYRLFKVPEDSANLYKKLLKSEDYEDLKTRLKINDYYYDFTPHNWIELDKLLKTDILPEKIKNQNLMIKNQIFSTTDNGQSFVFQIDEVAKKGSPAPYSYIKPTIKSVVLNKRKLNLLSEKKHKLYEKALENDEIKKK